MHIVSVNVGPPREVAWGNEVVPTGIFKQPIDGRVVLRRLNLDGDAQADLSVHGGPDKAVYAYPVEHYAYWREQLPDRELPLGIFGENLTLAGLTEDAAHIGDELRIGTARLVITQPRLPCFKLGIRFGDPAIVSQFLASNRPGFYLAVLEEGEIGAGDPVERVHEDENQLTVTELLRLMVHDKTNTELMRRALRVRHLAAILRKKFENRLRT
ncbi:MAG TPA: MOSC domain-containing protein [Gemmataceae bacterium]|nr:MOSC domain-containing protein [Gemmataceae bacterium]